LRALAGHPHDLDVVEHERPVAVVGDDHTNREKPVGAVLDFEDQVLLGGVVGVDGDGNLFVIVGFMQGIACGVSRWRRIEAFVAGKGQHTRAQQQRPQRNSEATHGPLIIGHEFGFSQLQGGTNRMSTSFMYTLYSLLLAAALLVSLPWWALQVL